MGPFIPARLGILCLLAALVACGTGCSRASSTGEEAPPSQPDASTPDDPTTRVADDISSAREPHATQRDEQADTARPPSTPQTWASRDVGADPARRMAVHALQAAGAALHRLPADAPIVVATADLGELLSVLGRERLAARYPDYAAALARPLEARSGYDLLDPAGWPSVGLDVDGPAGVAWLRADLSVAAAFVSVLDSQLALETLQGVLGPERVARLDRRVSDTAVVLHDTSQGGAFVVTADTFYWVFGAPGDETVAALADRLAGDTPDDGLAELGPTLSSGRHLAAHVALDTLLAAHAAPRATWADTELAAARRRGAPPDEMARLEQRALDLRARRTRQARLASTLLGSAGALEIGLELGDPGLRLDAHLALPDDALLRRVLRAPDALPPVLVSADDALLAALSLSLDPATLAEATTHAAELATGAPLDRDAVSAAVGFDAVASLLEIATGEVGLLVTGELPDAVETPLEGTLGIHLVVGVDDVEAAQALVDRLAEAEVLRAHVEIDDEDGDPVWAWTVPRVGRMQLRLGAERLVMSTSPAFVARVLGGRRGDLMRAEDGEERTTFLTSQGSSAAAVAAVDARLLAWWPVAAGGIQPGAGDSEDEPAANKKARRKLKQIRSLDAQIAELRVRNALARRQILLGALAELATVGLSIVPTDAGIAVSGGLYGKRSVASLVDTWLATGLELSLRADDVEITRLQEQRRRLVAELEALRAE